MTLADFRGILRRLSAAELAALLHEIGAELYRREITRWRVLGDIADELLTEATLAARVRLTETFFAARGKASTRSRRQRRRRLA